MTACACVLHPRIRCLTGEQVATIRGSDTDEVDRFGWSVAISGDPMSDMFVAVGAPGADDNGVLEVQELHCSTCPSTSQPMSGALLAPRRLPTITLGRRLPWLLCSANVVCACLCTLYPLLASNSRAAANSGSIRLSFDGVVSARIPWDADHDTLYLALTGIDSLYAVQVVMDGTTHQLCSAGGSVTTVTIVHPQVGSCQQILCAQSCCSLPH